MLKVLPPEILVTNPNMARAEPWDLLLICVLVVILNLTDLTIKSRAWYFQLLHSQRLWVQGMWCFVTTLQLVCFQLSLHYHLNQLRHFWQKQQMTIFALNCCPTSSLRFFVFLKCFSSSFFSHSFIYVLTSLKRRRSCCSQESYSLQRLILMRATQEVQRILSLYNRTSKIQIQVGFKYKQMA